MQKQNKAIKDESFAKIREEEEKRKETQAKFQKSLNVSLLIDCVMCLLLFRSFCYGNSSLLDLILNVFNTILGDSKDDDRQR